MKLENGKSKLGRTGGAVVTGFWRGEHRDAREAQVCEGRTGGQSLTVYRFGAFEEFPSLVLCATQVLFLTMEADGEPL